MIIKLFGFMLPLITVSISCLITGSKLPNGSSNRYIGTFLERVSANITFSLFHLWFSLYVGFSAVEKLCDHVFCLFRYFNSYYFSYLGFSEIFFLFIANRWGNNGKSERLYFPGLQNHFVW